MKTLILENAEVAALAAHGFNWPETQTGGTVFLSSRLISARRHSTNPRVTVRLSRSSQTLILEADARDGRRGTVYSIAEFRIDRDKLTTQRSADKLAAWLTDAGRKISENDKQAAERRNLADATRQDRTSRIRAVESALGWPIGSIGSECHHPRHLDSAGNLVIELKITGTPEEIASKHRALHKLVDPAVLALVLAS
jgi:hypothetical protein